MFIFQIKKTSSSETRFLNISGVHFNVDSLGRVKVVKSTIPEKMFASYCEQKKWVQEQYSYIKRLMIDAC